MKRALRRANSPMLVEEEPDAEQIYSMTDKPYYVDKAKYKAE